MSDDKKNDDIALRARNRTVMLTPEMTGQVRSRITQDRTVTDSSNNDSSGGFIAPGATPTPPSQPKIEPQRAVIATSQTQAQPLKGFLVSFDNGPQGEYFELRVGRFIITSELNATGSNILIDHPTVSPMHAILRIAPTGIIQVLDQLSEHGTLIKRSGSDEVETLSGDKSNLEHGDIIQFGERSFYICLIAQVNGR